MEMAVEQENIDNPATYGAMLAIIRRRRWYLWGLILIYTPATVATLQLTQSYRMTGIVFLIWFILLFIVATLAASSKCPRCGNNFHMRNSTLSFFRKCRHCGLHICGDKKAP
jgi:hypothetical protein